MGGGHGGLARPADLHRRTARSSRPLPARLPHRGWGGMRADSLAALSTRSRRSNPARRPGGRSSIGVAGNAGRSGSRVGLDRRRRASLEGRDGPQRHARLPRAHGGPVRAGPLNRTPPLPHARSRCSCSSPPTRRLLHAFGILFMGNDVLSPLLNVGWLGVRPARGLGRPAGRSGAALQRLLGWPRPLRRRCSRWASPARLERCDQSCALLHSARPWSPTGRGSGCRWRSQGWRSGLAAGAKATALGPQWYLSSRRP